jgi:hypothetical protein
MSTFAEQQFKFWSGQAETQLAQIDNQQVPDHWKWPEGADKAFKIRDAVEAYQPFDFQPGSNWAFILDNWMHAPKSTCRSLAIAAIAEIQHAIANYHA